MDLLRRIFSYLRKHFSKIQILLLLLVIVLGFSIGESSIFSCISYNRKINELENKIEYYETKKASDKKQLQEVNDNKERVEKVARESYKMKKEDEDIFILED